MVKGSRLIAAVGLTLGVLAGCGREANQPPAPQPLVLEMEPVGEAAERAEIRLFDLGRDAEVQIRGENFRGEGAYYATWGRAEPAQYWQIGLYPAPLTVEADGEGVYLGLFSIEDQAEPGDRIYVLYDADGDPGDRFDGAVPVLTAPLPSSLFP